MTIFSHAAVGMFLSTAHNNNIAAWSRIRKKRREEEQEENINLD